MSMGSVAPPESDPVLTRAWREVSGEQPPEALDDAIRAAARRAVHAGPRRRGANFVQRWRLPLSIAALVVVSASITLMISQRDAHLPIPYAERVTTDKAERAARPTKPTAAGELERDQALPGVPQAPPPATPTPAKDAADVLSNTEAHKQAARAERAAPVSPQAARSSEQPPASAPTPNPPTAEPPAAGAARAVAPTGVQGSQAGSARAPLEPALEAAKMRAPSATAVSPEPRSARAPEREVGAEAKSHADQPAPAQEGSPPGARARVKAPVAPAAPAQQAAEEDGAGALQPLEWIERIRELRRKGHGAEAEASLRAFRERYPDYTLPADLVAPR